jgi:hypothetical protein
MKQRAADLRISVPSESDHPPQPVTRSRLERLFGSVRPSSRQTAPCDCGLPATHPSAIGLSFKNAVADMFAGQPHDQRHKTGHIPWNMPLASLRVPMLPKHKTCPAFARSITARQFPPQIFSLEVVPFQGGRAAGRIWRGRASGGARPVGIATPESQRAAIRIAATARSPTGRSCRPAAC